MVRWFGLGQEPCWPAACCHKWAVISALGPGHWLQFTSAQQVRTAKVSIGFPMASARLPSKLNRNDRGTGKVQECTVVQINTLGEWSTDQIICETTSKGCCHYTSFRKSAKPSTGRKKLSSSGEKILKPVLFFLWDFSWDHQFQRGEENFWQWFSKLKLRQDPPEVHETSVKISY